MRKVVEMYVPGGHFPAVSVTGSRCELQCDHCRGRHLNGMESAVTDRELIDIACRVRASGGTGMLISGGCDLSGKVPVTEHSDAISTISEMGLEVNAHTGFLTQEEAECLVGSGVERFSMDIHQSPEIIRNVLHLDAGPEDYERTMDNILAASGTVVPHITVGFGIADMIMSAEMILSKGIHDVILLALIPTVGTDITEHLPADSIISAISMLMEMGMNVTLGCMRPRIYQELERKAIDIGVRRMANPSLRTIEWAEDNGYDVRIINKCCCMF